MDRSQFLNVPQFFDGNNYAFWKVRMREILCSIDDTIWDAVEAGWTRPEAAKSTWDKAALVAANANSKALNVISLVFLQMSFTGFFTLPLPKKHERYWKPPMKDRRK